MTVSDLRAQFVATLTRSHGGNPRRWAQALGDIRLHSLATHSHCNWSIAPSGSAAETDAIEALADTLRLHHPVVTRD